MDGFARNGHGFLPYSYVPEKDDEAYWTLAKNYMVGDRMFQSNTGPSFAAHQYMIAAQAADVAENPSGGVWGCGAAPSSTDPLIGPNGTELPGVYPCFDYQTAADLLDEKGVTWRYYAPGEGDSFFILSAYQAIRHIRYGNDWNKNVISPQNRVLVDIAHGELAQVTWIVPDWTHSDHPGSGSTRAPTGWRPSSMPSAKANTGTPPPSSSPGTIGEAGTITSTRRRSMQWGPASVFR